MKSPGAPTASAELLPIRPSIDHLLVAKPHGAGSTDQGGSGPRSVARPFAGAQEYSLLLFADVLSAPDSVSQLRSSLKPPHGFGCPRPPRPQLRKPRLRTVPGHQRPPSKRFPRLPGCKFETSL